LGTIVVPFSFLVFPSILPLMIGGVILNSNREITKAIVREVKSSFWNSVM
jgi:ABC-type tungstate transport system substrate-binding protein